jgi:hypothetical protein
VLDHVGHVNEIILFLAIHQKVADIVLDLKQAYSLRSPACDMRLVADTEVGAR